MRASDNQVATAVPVESDWYRITSPAFSNFENAVASVDYNISDRDSLRARFILNRNGVIDSTGFPSVFYQPYPPTPTL